MKKHFNKELVISKKKLMMTKKRDEDFENAEYVAMVMFLVIIK